MSARLTAAERLARLLAVIPWVVQRDGATLDDVATRFDYPRDQLVRDLTEVVFFVGVHPFTPDTMIEVDITDDRVRIRYADWFSRPLRLTADEAARLLTAGRSVLSLTPLADADDEAAGPLLRALTKLEMALGEAADTAVDVRLGDAPEATLDALRRATADGLQVEIEYYAYGRDELTSRRVDPSRVFSDQGNWYLHGWCHRAEGERVFRVDRIRAVAVSDRPAEHRISGHGASFTPRGDDPRVELLLDPQAAWVVEQYPTEGVVHEPDGRLRVTMAVAATPWLERLLLRLGPAAELVRVDDGVAPDLTRAAARRVLGRYRK